MGTSCCLSVSGLYLLVACALGHYARSIVDFMIERPGLVRSLLMEIITSLEWCACTFELVIVGDVYDKSMASVIMFLLLVWSSMTWGEATASPFLAVEALISNHIDIVTAALAISAQIAGAVLAPMYVDWMWELQHHCATHAVRASNVCDSAIKDHPLGGLITAVAVFTRRVVVRHTRNHRMRYGYVINAFVTTICYFIFQRYTGGHTNPLVITSLALACKETAYIRHIVIHWIGAVLGCISAFYMYWLISNSEDTPIRYSPISES